jgi:FixJ family two-component response regulator
MSGDMSEKIQERALKSGVIGFLQKPFADLALLNLLNRAFTWGKLK